MSFQAFTIAVDETGESTRLLRAMLFVIFVLVGGLFAWGGFAPMSGAVVADGAIKVESNRKSVQHLEGGIIRRIMVREGEKVIAGQPLLELDDTEPSATVNILTDNLNAMLVKEARLFAEASLRDSIDFPKELRQDRSEKTATLIRNELALFQSKRKMLLDQIALLKSQIEHASSATTSLQAQIGATEEGTRYMEEQLRAGEQLKAKHFLDNNALLELKEKLAQKREDLGEQKASLASQRQDISELELRIVNAKNDYARAADDELKEARKAIFEYQERVRPAQDMLQRKTITAPIGGQVIDLKATTIGGVIKPGDVILDIVPGMLDLILEVKIRPSDVDSVHVGQFAKVQLSAFNQRTTPMVDGTLTYLSGDALVDETGPRGESYYKAYIKTDPESVKQLGDLPLSPGMPVVAYVQTSPRTFFEYILSPLTSQLRRALTEE